MSRAKGISTFAGYERYLRRGEGHLLTASFLVDFKLERRINWMLWLTWPLLLKTQWFKAVFLDIASVRLKKSKNALDGFLNPTVQEINTTTIRRKVINTEISVGRQTCASTVTSLITEIASAITFDVCCILSTVSTRMADNCFTILDFIYNKILVKIRSMLIV